MMYLLANINGGSLDPNVLASEAKAFIGLMDEHAIEAMKIYLLCQIANK